MKKKPFVGILLAVGILSGCGGVSAETLATEESVPQTGQTVAAALETEIETKSAGEAESESVADSAGETDSAVTAAEKDEVSTVVGRQDAQSIPDGMAVWNNLPFFWNDAEWELVTCVTQEAVATGEFAPDDSCRFLIKAVSPEGEYCLFDEQVQLGTPAADVWTDQQNRLHIVIRDSRTARYRITDFSFDERESAFYGVTEMDYDGINYWGSLEF